MKMYRLRVPDEVVRMIEEEYKAENLRRERKGLPKIQKGEFLVFLLKDALIRLRREREKEIQEEVLKAEDRARRFVESFRSLELMSLLGGDNVKFEKMEW